MRSARREPEPKRLCETSVQVFLSPMYCKAVVRKRFDMEDMLSDKNCRDERVRE